MDSTTLKAGDRVTWTSPLRNRPIRLGTVFRLLADDLVYIAWDNLATGYHTVTFRDNVRTVDEDEAMLIVLSGDYSPYQMQASGRTDLLDVSDVEQRYESR